MTARIDYGDTVASLRRQRLLQKRQFLIFTQADCARLHNVANPELVKPVLQGPVQVPQVEQTDDRSLVQDRPAGMSDLLHPPGDIAQLRIGGQGLHPAA